MFICTQIMLWWELLLWWGVRSLRQYNRANPTPE